MSRRNPFGLRAPMIGEPTPEHEPNFTLDWQIARARKEMGEARWNELQAEWEANWDQSIASLQGDSK